MKKTILALALALPILARAEWFEPPNAVDIALQAAATTVTFFDWSQTAYHTQSDYWHATGHWELNPILGRYPSRSAVNLYMGSIALGQAAIAYALPRPWRNIWQVAYIAVEGPVVVRNFNIGVKMTLKF